MRAPLTLCPAPRWGAPMSQALHSASRGVAAPRAISWWRLYACLAMIIMFYEAAPPRPATPHWVPLPCLGAADCWTLSPLDAGRRDAFGSACTYVRRALDHSARPL